MISWLIFYLLDVLFWLWVVRWGGADWLEGTFTSGFLVHFFAPTWTSEGIKIIVWIQFIGATLWFIFGVFDPSLRV